MAKYNWSKKLPKRVSDGIEKYRVAYRQEMYQEELYQRRAFLQNLDEDEFDIIWCGDDPDRWDDFITRCVDVYMDD